eukprot:4429666-Alexandrium_andersonii.AAC.1
MSALRMRARRLRERHFRDARPLPEARLRNALLFAAYTDKRVARPVNGVAPKPIPFFGASAVERLLLPDVEALRVLADDITYRYYVNLPARG